MSVFFFFSSRRRHTRCSRDWSSDVCSSDLSQIAPCFLQRSGLGVYTGNFLHIGDVPPPALLKHGSKFSFHRFSQRRSSTPGQTATTNQSGIFPCFLGGLVSRLVSSMRRAVMSFGRVSRGWMTASI